MNAIIFRSIFERYVQALRCQTRKEKHPFSLKVFGDKFASKFVRVCRPVGSLVVSSVIMNIEAYSGAKKRDYFKVHTTGYFDIRTFTQITQACFFCCLPFFVHFIQANLSSWYEDKTTTAISLVC